MYLAAPNTGSFKHHMFIIQNHLEQVAEYKEFNDEKPFDPIKLEGAITNPDAFNENEKGMLNAVIFFF